MRKMLVFLVALALLVPAGALAQGKTLGQPAFTPVLPVGVELSNEELAEVEGKLAPLVKKGLVLAGQAVLTGSGGAAVSYLVRGEVDWRIVAVTASLGAGVRLYSELTRRFWR
ncbi:MAG: class IIb bacteriocin, lactobin A/cerein 7B family [Truepera sp.]|nr:class IIb bacteriocin, lactobin A/cerein 7B family [Truepera sp.]